jgi:hypothetical protein
VTIAADDTKLPLFLDIKGAPGGPDERYNHTYNIKGSYQRRGWFNELVARKWVDAIVKPYVREE